MTELEYVVNEVLDSGLDDWVPIDSLIRYAYEATRETGGDFKKLALDALNYLLVEGLVEVGDLGESGFEAWPTPPAETTDRLVRELDKLDWQPFGGLCWISNTAKGDQRIRQESGT